MLIANGGDVADFKYVEWQMLCQEALREFDPDKLAQRVSAAETAISLRLQKISISAEGNLEGRAIQKALKDLAGHGTRENRNSPIRAMQRYAATPSQTATLEDRDFYGGSSLWFAFIHWKKN
jgi:hypothetical protein